MLFERKILFLCATRFSNLWKNRNSLKMEDRFQQKLQQLLIGKNANNIFLSSERYSNLALTAEKEYLFNQTIKVTIPNFKISFIRLKPFVQSRVCVTVHYSFYGCWTLLAPFSYIQSGVSTLPPDQANMQ